jgi:hypothetical protein
MVCEVRPTLCPTIVLIAEVERFDSDVPVNGVWQEQITKRGMRIVTGGTVR